MHHKTADAPKTAGRVIHGGIHGAHWYDLFVRVTSFGRDRAIREKLIELASPAPGDKVLDVGCGTGTLAIAIKPQVGTGEVHGIDASPEMIQVAKEKSAKDGSDIDFRVALIEAIPFPDASFDLVTSSLMLHHLPDNLKAKGFLEIRRVLKPGGRFMVMDFAAHSHSRLGHHLPSILGHSRGESMVDKLTPMLRDAGFSDVEGILTRHKNFAFIRARQGVSKTLRTTREKGDAHG
ncbi:MAG: methyltransferase domain-containing protein [Chloroflexi bacterium]|nr:methyltransferase domain-containing protein [Chloroflexota bacterium]